MLNTFKQLTKAFFIIALFVLSFVTASFAGAQTAKSSQSNDVEQQPGYVSLGMDTPAEGIKGPGIVSCFDYYHFGSVQVNMETNVITTVSGTPITFFGQIANQNNYPIVHGSAYAKVFKKQTDASLTQQNGNDLVDQFFVKEDLNLSANSKTPLQFEWKIPAYAVSGDYQIAFFFTSAHKFNLLGLSFTDDVVGNVVNFSITGEQKSIPFFKKNTVKLNNSLYRFASFIPHFKVNEDVIATVELTNPSNETKVVQILWKLYSWDAQNENNILDTEREDVALNPGETKVLKYTDTKMTGVVHFLVAEAKYKDTKSLLDIRYTRDGSDALRLNFPAVTNYPLEENKEAILFSCLHNMRANTVKDSKLILILKDQNGKLLHTYTYIGGVSGEMMAVKDTFTPKETLKDFSLEATLFQSEREVDKVTMIYDCKKLGGKDCGKEEEKKESLIMGIDSNTLKIAMALFVLLLVVLSLIVIKKRKQKNEMMNISDEDSSVNPTKLLMLALLIATSWSFGGTNRAEASSVSWTSAPLKSLGICLKPSGIYCSDYTQALYSGTVATIQYNANIKNYDTGAAILNTQSVPISTRISFPITKANTDISWSGIGTYSDTPYGIWIDQAERPDPSVITNFLTSSMTGQWELNIYIPLSVHRPVETITSLTPSTLSCNLGICSIIDNGVAKAKVTFPQTYGKFYYKCAPGTVWDIPAYCEGTGTYPQSAMRTDLYGYPTPMKPEYKLIVPEQSITFTLSAVDPNNPPSDPVVTPFEGNDYLVDTYQGFNIKSSDPDGDSVQYCIDWGADMVYKNNCEVLSGLQVQNTNWPTYPIFSTTGSKKFWVKAIDDNGSSSGWVLHTFTITNAPVNGECSTVTPSICINGTYVNTPVDTTTNFNWSCNGKYGGTSLSCTLRKPITATCGTTLNSCPKGGPVNDLDDTATTYDWECPGFYGGADKACWLLKPKDGTCGSANDRIFASTDTSYSPFLQCGSGNPSISAFPSQGGSVSWICNGAGTGASSSGTCTASRYALCTGTYQSLNTEIHPGDNVNVTVNTPYSYSLNDTATQCQYHCNTASVRNAANTACEIPSCQGIAPSAAAHTELYPNDNIGIPKTLPFPSYTYSSSNATNIFCEYKCVSGYVRSGTTCIIDSDCGTASKTYLATISPEAFPSSDTFCTAGTPVPATPSFPAKGATVTWTCGLKTCSASRGSDIKCGYKNNIPSLTKPKQKTATDKALCSNGSTPVITLDTAPTPDLWKWTCGTALCSAPKSTFSFWEF